MPFSIYLHDATLCGEDVQNLLSLALRFDRLSTPIITLIHWLKISYTLFSIIPVQLILLFLWYY